MHAVDRTSPLGSSFVGRCRKCGRDGLTLRAALEECPADDVMSDEAALLDILEKPHHCRGTE